MNINVQEVVLQSQIRHYVKFGGASPLNKLEYAGIDVDAVYGSRVNCSASSIPNGTQLIYLLMAGDASNPPSVAYSTNGGASFTDVAIGTGVANDTTVHAIAVAGNRLVVVMDAVYWLATINRVTGLPENWQAINTGIPAVTLSDVYVANMREVYFSASGGTVLKSTNLLNGVTVIAEGIASNEDLTRIEGYGETLVVGGAGASISISKNRGVGWADYDVTGNDWQAVALTGRDMVWAGNVLGDLYYSDNGGVNWTNITLDVALTNIQDIAFATPEVGYILGADASGQVMLTTIDGGENWFSGRQWRLDQLPTSTTYNRLAVPEVIEPQVSGNYVLVSGAGAAGAGLLSIGVGS